LAVGLLCVALNHLGVQVPGISRLLDASPEQVTMMVMLTASIVALVFATVMLAIAGTVNRISKIVVPPLKRIMEIEFPQEVGDPQSGEDNDMKKQNKWTGQHALFAGLLGAVAFILAFVLGSAVNALTGIPLTGGVLNGIVVGAVITVAIKGVDRFGAATLTWFVFTVIAIPTITFGPQGVYKPVVGVLSGLVWDSVIWLFKKLNMDKAGYIVGAGFGAAAITLGVFGAALLIGLPAADRLRSALAFLVPLNFVISAGGAWAGLWLFDNYVAGTPVVRRMRKNGTATDEL